jgi:fused signal recognition particle receptor
VKTSGQLVKAVKEKAAAQDLKEAGQVRDLVRSSVVETLSRPITGDLLPKGRPTVLIVVGVNGVGKTTGIAKMARAAQADGRKVLLAAADTFRAGAIEQLKVWGQRLGVDVIAHQAGGDPGAVAFDAMTAARARGADLVIIDTAGRLHTKHNLMEELKKVRATVDRQAQGFLVRTLLVIDGTTGQNGLAQARAFLDAVKCEGVMLTKLDGTARGGIVLAIAGELGLPVVFIGTGEGIEDISTFDPEGFAAAVLPEPAAA